MAAWNHDIDELTFEIKYNEAIIEKIYRFREALDIFNFWEMSYMNKEMAIKRQRLMIADLSGEIFSREKRLKADKEKLEKHSRENDEFDKHNKRGKYKVD